VHATLAASLAKCPFPVRQTLLGTAYCFGRGVRRRRSCLRDAGPERNAADLDHAAGTGAVREHADG
jgi:hypothetical protein